MILELFEITFSMSFSSFTKRFPVEEPANNFTPQQPSRLFNFFKSSVLCGVAPK